MITLGRLNSDTSWTITLGTTTFLVDPWLKDSEIDGLQYFNEQWHTKPCVDIGDVGPFDAVIVSHEFSDHCHESTLLEFPQHIPIFASSGAKSRLTSHPLLGARDIRLIPSARDQWCEFKDCKIKQIPGHRFLDFVHNAIVIMSSHGSLFYAPHGFLIPPDSTRYPCLEELKTHEIDICICTMSTYNLPIILGGQINLGLEGADALVKFLEPKIVVDCHSEVKKAQGLVPMLATTAYPSHDEIKSKIPNYIALDTLAVVDVTALVHRPFLSAKAVVEDA